jgi:uncharacterized membrane protein YccC
MNFDKVVLLGLLIGSGGLTVFLVLNKAPEPITTWAMRLADQLTGAFLALVATNMIAPIINKPTKEGTNASITDRESQSKN